MQLKIQRGASKPAEWFLIEMQGDLESRSKDHLEGKFIGDLHFNKQGVPVMIIGHHILYGKEIELDQPVVAITKDSPQEQGMDLGDEEQPSPSNKYQVKAIIRNKLIFKARPKPIIANVPKKM
jgi:chromosome transmission fidelity protein 8